MSRNKSVAGAVSGLLVAIGTLSLGSSAAGRQQVAYKPEVPWLSLLSFEDIGEELRFTRAQHKLADEARSLRPHIGEESDQKQAVQQTLYATLSASQKERLVELSIQHRWPDSLLSDYVSKAIALTDEQRARIEVILKSYFSLNTMNSREAESQREMGDPAKSFLERLAAAKVWRDASKRQQKEQGQKLDARAAKVEAVLTKEQLQLANDLQGREYPVRYSYRQLDFPMRMLLSDRHVQVDLGFSLKESVTFFDALESSGRNPDKTGLSGNQFFDGQFERLTSSQKARLRQATLQVYGARTVLTRYAAEQLRLTAKQRADLVIELADIGEDEKYDLFALDLQRQAKVLAAPVAESGKMDFQLRALNEQGQLEDSLRRHHEARRQAILAKLLTKGQARKWKDIQGARLTFLDIVRRNHAHSYF